MPSNFSKGQIAAKVQSYKSRQAGKPNQRKFPGTDKGIVLKCVGNFLPGGEEGLTGKRGANYHKWGGLCLMTQVGILTLLSVLAVQKKAYIRGLQRDVVYLC